MAGTGKSTLARTVARRCRDEGRLGTSFVLFAPGRRLPDSADVHYQHGGAAGAPLAGAPLAGASEKKFAALLQRVPISSPTRFQIGRLWLVQRPLQQLQDDNELLALERLSDEREIDCVLLAAAHSVPLGC
jgi:hypothetical protein